jgi:hypothetical protein
VGEESALTATQWIGLVHVRSSGPADSLGKGRKGGYTHALGLAASADEFLDRVQAALGNWGLLAIEFEDVAPLAQYAGEGRISEEMWGLARLLSAEAPVQFDILDTYREHDA